MNHKFLYANNHSQTSGFSHISMDGLTSMAKTPRIGTKDTAPIFAPHDGQAKTKEGASLAQFSALILDFDEGNRSATALNMILVDAGGYLAFTSSSHQQPKGNEPPANRWKVIVPFSRSIDADQYASLAVGAALKFDTDPAQARLSQICYVPNKISTDAPYEIIDHTDRKHIDPETSPFAIACLSAFEAHQSEQEANAKAAPIKQRTSDFSQSASVIQMANDAYDVRSILDAEGYKPRGKKYLAPNSSTGIPGVIVITCDDDKERVYSHHSPASDPLADGHAHDAFDLLLILRFGGDMTAAIKTLSAELDQDGQKERQREYMQSQADQRATVAVSELKRSKATTERLNEDQQPFDFGKFAINERLSEMKEKMLNDVFVLGELALLGQITAIYAKPNTGKTLITLKLIIDAVRDGRINGGDVFYINADDSYKGLIQKADLCAAHGINALAPGENDFNTKQFLTYLEWMIKQDSARGKVIILDTLKKFADLMSKEKGTEFMKTARLFAQHGGTVILLAHTNKRRDVEGKVIFGGTSDIVDDADCAYTLDETAIDHLTKTVLFENIKARGNVAKTAAYTYSNADGLSYIELLDSVQSLSEADIDRALADKARAEEREKDQQGIDAISEAIKTGFSSQSELLTEAASLSGISKPRLVKILNKYKGGFLDVGSEWSAQRGAHNRMTYSLHRGQILEATPTL